MDDSDDDTDVDSLIAIHCNPGESTVSAVDNTMVYFKLDLIGFTLSFVALAFVGFVILSDKRI